MIDACAQQLIAPKIKPPLWAAPGAPSCCRAMLTRRLTRPTRRSSVLLSTAKPVSTPLPATGGFASGPSQILSMASRGLGRGRFSDVIDTAAIDAAQRLRRQLLANGRIDNLQCERFVHALKERTIWALSGISIAPAARSWMTPRRLRLVDELIEARLDAKLTVSELAAALRLSTGFFCRAFKASVGKAPHDYIIDRRVSRARALLQSTPLDLSAVAHASGFASHAHMTATFRNRLGVTPSALRT